MYSKENKKSTGRLYISSLKLKLVLQFCFKILLLPPYREIGSDPEPDPKFPEMSDPDTDPKENNFGSTTLI